MRSNGYGGGVAALSNGHQHGGFRCGRRICSVPRRYPVQGAQLESRPQTRPAQVSYRTGDGGNQAYQTNYRSNPNPAIPTSSTTSQTCTDPLRRCCCPRVNDLATPPITRSGRVRRMSRRVPRIRSNMKTRMEEQCGTRTR